MRRYARPIRLLQVDTPLGIRSFYPRIWDADRISGLFIFGLDLIGLQNPAKGLPVSNQSYLSEINCASSRTCR